MLGGGIWNDHKIHEWAEQGGVTPFDPKLVSVASLDMRIAPIIKEVIVGRVSDASTGTRPRTKTNEFKLEYGQEYVLTPGTFVLASSQEYIKMPITAAGLTMLKSTPARRGIGHVYAGYIDPGFEGNITFELFSHVPVHIEPGMLVCQLVMMEMISPPNQSYAERGRYGGQVGPTEDRFDRERDVPDNQP